MWIKLKTFFYVFKDRCKNSYVCNNDTRISGISIYPYMCGNKEQITNFKRFIKYLNIEIIDINYEVAELGAKLRGNYHGFKAMDALQIASAIYGKCDIFLQMINS